MSNINFLTGLPVNQPDQDIEKYEEGLSKPNAPKFNLTQLRDLRNAREAENNRLDIQARQSAMMDINPFMTGDIEGALQVVTRQNKSAIAAFKKAGVDLSVEVITEAEAKNRPDYKKTDKGYYTTIKDGKATITYIMEKYNFELAMHEQSHALSDIYFGKDIKFNRSYLSSLSSPSGMILSCILLPTPVATGAFGKSNSCPLFVLYFIILSKVLFRACISVTIDPPFSRFCESVSSKLTIEGLK